MSKISYPKRISGPRLDISVESSETFRLLDKMKKSNFIIPYPYTLADVEWIKGAIWYKPWTWGNGYIRIKDSAIAEVTETKELA